MNENLQSHWLSASAGRFPYVQPRIKVRPCEASGLLAGSGGGNGAGQAGQADDIDDGAIFGGGAAKALPPEGQGISFPDVWED